MSEPGEDTVPIPQTQLTGVLVSQWESQTGTSEYPNGTKTIRLTDGTYYLVETKAPPGHMGLSSPIVFTVDVSKGTINVTENPGWTPSDEDNTDTVINVYNSVMVTLPETGGVGAAPYRLLGVGMMLATVLMLYRGHKSRRRGRRAEGS